MSYFGTQLQRTWKRNLFLYLEQLEMMESFGEEKHGICEATF